VIAVTTDEQPQWAPYEPALLRAAQAMAGAAIVAFAVELIVQPHREISAVFLGVGLIVGALVGRHLARELAEWCAEAPEVTAAEAERIVEPRPSYLAAAGLIAAAILAIVVPIGGNIPTPIPGGLAAGVVQTLLQTSRRRRNRTSSTRSRVAAGRSSVV